MPINSAPLSSADLGGAWLLLFSTKGPGSFSIKIGWFVLLKIKLRERERAHRIRTAKFCFFPSKSRSARKHEFEATFLFESFERESAIFHFCVYIYIHRICMYICWSTHMCVIYIRISRLFRPHLRNNILEGLSVLVYVCMYIHIFIFMCVHQYHASLDLASDIMFLYVWVY